jgi:hypothetical protein
MKTKLPIVIEVYGYVLGVLTHISVIFQSMITWQSVSMVKESKLYGENLLQVTLS